MRRRFPRAAIARYDGEARGKRAEAQRAAAAMADVVVGTRGAVKLFGPGTLGLAAFVSPDPQLRLPDFRAAEQTFALMWAVTERVRADGAVIVQSQNPVEMNRAVTERERAGRLPPGDGPSGNPGNDRRRSIRNCVLFHQNAILQW